MAKTLYYIRRNRGLDSFFLNKKLNHIETVKGFLSHIGSTVSYKNGEAVEDLIVNDWDRFCSYVDKGVRSGELKGVPVSVSNGSREAEKEHHREWAAEMNTFSPEIIHLWAIIKKFDDPMRLSKCASFMNKKGVRLPANNSEYLSRIGKSLPKLELILNSPHKDELIAFLSGQAIEQTH